MADVDPAQRALRFLAAGGDLMIIGDAGLVDRMVRACGRRWPTRVVRGAGAGQRDQGAWPLKARRGLVECRA
jgi:hypothetical protein